MAKKKATIEESPASPAAEPAKTAGGESAAVRKSSKIPKLAKKNKSRLPRREKKALQRKQTAQGAATRL